MASFNPRGDRSFIHAILSFVALPLLPGRDGRRDIPRPKLAGIRPENDETARESRRGHIYFPLDGSDTGSRVATSRRDSGCRPVHAQAPKRHLNYRLRLFTPNAARPPTPRFLQLFPLRTSSPMSFFSSGVHVNFRGITRTVTFARSFSKEEVRGSRQLIPRISYRVEGRSPKTGDRKEASCQDWKRGPAGIDGHHL